MYLAWTDGAARKGADGAWHAGVAVILVRGTSDGAVVRESSSYHSCSTTSQQAELLAVIEALEMVSPGEHIHIDTDSMYVVEGLLGKWNLRQNAAIWTQLRNLVASRDAEFTHIPRCSDPESIEVDALAKRAMRECP